MPRNNDDGLPWGYISPEHGDWVNIAKSELVVKGYGPPPFDLTLPDGRVLHVIHQPLPKEEWECPICKTNLAWPQPIAPSCPAECPLRAKEE